MLDNLRLLSFLRQSKSRKPFSNLSGILYLNRYPDHTRRAIHFHGGSTVPVNFGICQLITIAHAISADRRWLEYRSATITDFGMMGGSTAENITPDSGGDVSKEWGFGSNGMGQCCPGFESLSDWVSTNTVGTTQVVAGT